MVKLLLKLGLLVAFVWSLYGFLNRELPDPAFEPTVSGGNRG